MHLNSSSTRASAKFQSRRYTDRESVHKSVCYVMCVLLTWCREMPFAPRHYNIVLCKLTIRVATLSRLIYFMRHCPGNRELASPLSSDAGLTIDGEYARDYQYTCSYSFPPTPNRFIFNNQSESQPGRLFWERLRGLLMIVKGEARSQKST